MIEHATDQEDPAYAVEWTDRAGELIDFTSGYTFEIRLVRVDNRKLLLTKTTGIAGATPVAGEPNVVAVWAIGELAALPACDVFIYLKATSAATRDRRFSPGNPDRMRLIAPPPAA